MTNKYYKKIKKEDEEKKAWDLDKTISKVKCIFKHEDEKRQKKRGRKIEKAIKKEEKRKREKKLEIRSK